MTEVRGSSQLRWLIATCLLFTLLGGVLGGWAVYALMNDEPARASSGAVDTLATSGGLTAEELRTIEVIERSIGSVVRIVVHRAMPSDHPVLNIPTPSVVSSGSGFVYDEAGRIVTNYHVVDGSVEVQVLYANGERRTGRVIGADRLTDLAVIEVEDPPEVRPLPLADSDAVRVGQMAIAVGSPLAGESGMSFGLDGAPTVTKGIVSAVDRALPVMSRDNPRVREFEIKNLIQTDAAINQGNSGGPLLNSAGEVIGVNTAIAPGAQGIGFAIPSNTVKRVVAELIERGEVSRAYLGITFQDLALVRGYLGDAVDLPVEAGAVVIDVKPGTPAARAGLRGSDFRQTERLGDIITAVDGRPVTGENLAAVILSYRPGDEVELTVYRDGSPLTIRVTLGRRD